MSLVTFPKTADEARNWKPFVMSHALHQNVLAVAKTRIDKTWKAYIAPVDGVNHRAEEQSVLMNGTALSEEIARPMFPYLKDVEYAD